MSSPEYTLEEWLDHALGVKEIYSTKAIPSHSFPKTELLNQYIASIESRSFAEIKSLLRTFLIKSGESPWDDMVRNTLAQNENVEDLVNKKEFFRRMMTPGECVWEGITWILDLLPNHPKSAIAVIEAYDAAHYFELPDGRILSLMDAIAIIRAKFLHCVDGYGLLKTLDPRDIEYLVSSLFLQNGVKVRVTGGSRDGGFDIVVEEDSETQLNRTLIECKHIEKKVDVDVVRRLNGVLTENKASSGKIITSSTFTQPAKKFARDSARIELIDGVTLCKKLNEKHGADWFRFASIILRRTKEKLISLD